ncbi:NUDIX domain-containing protein [Vicingaceae bacterium]|nr:NUDIX domain-containing protein [Vicingaceae bacterium]MDB4061777.1 NUDIX domain-containing protein [Vicingaceae bacterium]MDC1451779.1 NUDIX domain-containing protein [Vicingaceae bacterium]
MQRYQVFTDEHSIFIEEKVKSNQQFESFFELNEPDVDELIFVIEWLLKQKEVEQHVFLYSKDAASLWALFQDQFSLISAAGGKVQNSLGELLFIYRLGKWDLPKGKMEAGETPEQSALREVEEECGIKNLKLGSQLPNTYHVYVQNEERILKTTYWFIMDYAGNEQLTPQKEEAIEKALWVSTSDLSEQLANTYKSLVDLISS